MYRDGVNPGEVDEGLFDPIPPQKCVKGFGSATFRVGCDDDGNPIPDKVRLEIHRNLVYNSTGYTLHLTLVCPLTATQESRLSKIVLQFVVGTC